MIMESKPKSRLTKTNSGNNNSSRFLQCFFRPPEIDMDMDTNVRGCTDRWSRDRDRHRDHDHRPVFTYVDVGDGGGGGNNKEHNGGGVEMKRKGGRGGGRRQKLLLMMRAVMFETSLAKKIRKKKQKQKPSQSGNADDENKRIISRNSSAITSSSSSFSSNPSYHSDRINSFRSDSNHTLERKQKQDSSFHGANIGFCLLFISLFVLVFWGRVCAIICASTWLFFVPGRWSPATSRRKCSRLWKLDSNKYKKKIIMDGLVERNHSHS